MSIKKMIKLNSGVEIKKLGLKTASKQLNWDSSLKRLK